MLAMACVVWMGVAAQEPQAAEAVPPPAAAAEPAAVEPAPAAEAAPGAAENAPPPMYDEAAEDASRARDKLIKRILGWSTLGVGAVGLGLVGSGLLTVLAGGAMWVYVHQTIASEGKSPGDVYKLLGNGLMGAGALCAILAAPALVLGGTLFTVFYSANGL